MDSYNKDAIVYVEPNMIEYQYEDLSIFFMLIVDIPSRHKITISDGCTITWDGKQKKVNIVTGGKDYLTTFYTDLSYHDKFNGGDPEAFGIEDVSIVYNTYYFPDVTIKFVDIRGSALFKSADLTREQNTGGAKVSSFFQAFFTFPFPTFHMTVKGFFGKPVTYDMTAVDFKSRFNSASGNFEATVKFTGLVYGCLADIPMKYLMTAPFFKGAEGKLGKFSDSDVDIPTIPGFIDIITHAKASVVESVQGAGDDSSSDNTGGVNGNTGGANDDTGPIQERVPSNGRARTNIHPNARTLQGLGPIKTNLMYRSGRRHGPKGPDLYKKGCDQEKIQAEVSLCDSFALPEDAGYKQDKVCWGCKKHKTEWAEKGKSIIKFMTWVGRDHLKTIVHCDAGRDRTGIFCFIIESVLGCSKQDIYDDYILSCSAGKGYAPADMRACNYPGGNFYKQIGKTQDEVINFLINKCNVPEGLIQDFISTATDAKGAKAQAKTAEKAEAPSSSVKAVILGDSLTFGLVGGSPKVFHDHVEVGIGNVDAYGYIGISPYGYLTGPVPVYDYKPLVIRKNGTNTKYSSDKKFPERWDKDKSDYSGKIGVILLGDNMHKGYADLVENMHDAGIKVVMVRMPKNKTDNPNSKRTQEPNWSDLKQKYGALYVDLFSLGSKLKFGSDGLHYTEDSRPIFADAIHKIIINALNNKEFNPGGWTPSEPGSGGSGESGGSGPVGLSDASAMREKIIKGEFASTYGKAGKYNKKLVLHRYALVQNDGSQQGTVYGVYMGLGDDGKYKYLADTIESKLHIGRGGNWNSLKPGKHPARFIQGKHAGWSFGSYSIHRSARRAGNSLIASNVVMGTVPKGTASTPGKFTMGSQVGIVDLNDGSNGILCHIGKRNGDEHYDPKRKKIDEVSEKEHELEYTRGCILVGGDISGYNGFNDYPDEFDSISEYPNCDTGAIKLFNKFKSLASSGNATCKAVQNFYSYFPHGVNGATVDLLITGHKDKSFSDVIQVSLGGGSSESSSSGGQSITIKASLGFDPSIRKMFEIILAHLRLFITIYGSLINDITNTTDGSRNVGGSIIQNTDIYGNKDSFVGPFPGVFNPDGDNGPEYMWLGDHRTFRNYLEVGFINEFYRAAKLGYEKYEDAFKTLESMDFLNKQSTPEFKFLPTMLTDFFHSGTNPYQDIFTMSCGKTEALVYAFYTRYALFALGGDCSIFLSQDGKNTSTKLTKEAAQKFAAIEAYNVYMANEGFKPGENGVKDSSSSVMQILRHEDTSNYKNFPLNHGLICSSNNFFGLSSTACGEECKPSLTEAGKQWCDVTKIPFSYKVTLKALLEGDFKDIECGIIPNCAGVTRLDPVKNFDALYDMKGFAANTAIIIGVEDYNQIKGSISTLISKNSTANYGDISFKDANAPSGGTDDMGGTIIEQYGKVLDKYFNVTDDERKYDNGDIKITGTNIYYNILNGTKNKKEFDGFTIFAEKNGIITKPKANWAFASIDDDTMAALLLVDVCSMMPFKYFSKDKAITTIETKDIANNKKAEPVGVPFEIPSVLAGLIGACCDPTICKIYLETGTKYRYIKGVEQVDTHGSKINSGTVTVGKSSYVDFSLGMLLSSISIRRDNNELVVNNYKNLLCGVASFTDGNLPFSTMKNPLWENDGTLGPNGITRYAFYNFYKDTYLPKFKTKVEELKTILKKEHFKTMGVLGAGIFGNTDGIAMNDHGLSAVTDWVKSVYQDHVAVMYPFYISDAVLRTSPIDKTKLVPYGHVAKPDTDIDFAVVYETFVNALGSYYGEDIKTASESIANSVVTDRERSATKDQLKAMYLTMKNLFDRWHLNNDTLPLVAGPNKDFSNFKFYDSFRNDIGNTVMVDPIDFLQLCQKVLDSGSEENEGMSVYAFMEELCKMNDMVFFSLPMDIYEETSTYETIQEMFKPLSYYNSLKVEPNTTTFICMYSNKFSEHLNTSEMGGEYEDDGADFLHDTDIMAYMGRESLEKGEDRQITKKLPLFGVTPGYSDQHIFKSVSIGMDNPKNTSYSLLSTQFISNKNTERELSSIGYVGQNTYNVYATTSYSCEVSMMGNACIMPSMYFQLNNIPLFNGTYMITSVRHNIHAGQITTSFTGMRMNKHCLEYSKELLDLSGLVVAYNVGGSGSGGVAQTYNSGNVPTLSPDASKAEIIAGTLKQWIDFGVTNCYMLGGIILNLIYESGLDPKATNPTSKAYGLYQWIHPQNLEKWCKDNGKSMEDPNAQTAYMLSTCQTKDVFMWPLLVGDDKAFLKSMELNDGLSYSLYNGSNLVQKKGNSTRMIYAHGTELINLLNSATSYRDAIVFWALAYERARPRELSSRCHINSSEARSIRRVFVANFPEGYKQASGKEWTYPTGYDAQYFSCE